MIIEIILLILAIPVGYLIAYLTRDELKQGRNLFSWIVIVSLAFGAFFWIFGLGYIALTLVFIGIVSFISLVKGSDKKWIRKRI